MDEPGGARKERNMRLEMHQVETKRRRDTTIIPFENVRASFMDDGKLSYTRAACRLIDRRPAQLRKARKQAKRGNK